MVPHSLMNYRIFPSFTNYQITPLCHYNRYEESSTGCIFEFLSLSVCLKKLKNIYIFLKHFYFEGHNSTYTNTANFYFYNLTENKVGVSNYCKEGFVSWRAMGKERCLRSGRNRARKSLNV